MKSIILITLIGLLSTSACTSQINNAKSENVKVYANCDMCETTIEKVGTKKKEYKTDWNVDTKIATITYDSEKTTLDAVLKNIALSGYDNVKYLAPDEVYAKLPGCCQYGREKKATTKSEKKDTSMVISDHSGHNQTNETATQESNQLQSVFLIITLL